MLAAPDRSNDLALWSMFVQLLKLSSAEDSARRQSSRNLEGAPVGDTWYEARRTVHAPAHERHPAGDSATGHR